MPYKHDYDKILTRLVTILSRLHDGEALSVTELAEEFGVSRRTIQRDLNQRLISFPIYQEGKKWRMQEGYRLEKSLSFKEQLILDILEGFACGAGDIFAMESRKLLSRLKNQDDNPIYAKLNIEPIDQNLHEIKILESAIKERRIITCRYRRETGIPASHYRLKPLKIVNYEGFWYLVALHEDTLKKYYLRNIIDTEMTRDSFEIENKLHTLLHNSLSVWFRDDVEPFDVVLSADQVAAKYFRRRPLPTQTIIEEGEDGSMLFSVRITHEMEILPLVKYWIPHLFIRHPRSLAEQIEHDLRSYLETSCAEAVS